MRVIRNGTYLCQIFYGTDTVYFRRGSGTNFDGKDWIKMADSEDLASYLPKSGGTVSGNINMSYNKNILWNNNGSIWCSGSQQMFLRAQNDGNYVLHLGVHDSTWTLDPDVSGNLQLGTANHKWGTLYSTSGTIQTSDRNAKHDIHPLSEDDRYLTFFQNLLPRSYMFNDGKSGRIHVGFVAQDVAKAMESAGLSDLEFAGFCRDQKTVPVQKIMDIQVLDEKTGEKRAETITYTEDEPVEGKHVYSLRYEEFIALNTLMIQKLMERFDALESKYHD